MITGKTPGGFAFEIDEKALDDMNLVDALAEASGDDPLQFSRAVRLLLGDDQRRRLYEHLKEEDGRVPLERVGQALNAIFAAAGNAGKNS